MLQQHLVLAFIWILFCALHSGLASIGAKQKAQKLMGRHFRLYRLWYTLFAFASLGAVVIYQLSIATTHLYAPNTFSKILGGLVCLSGVVIMGVCIRKYFMHLSGLKSLYLNDEQAANKLQISGIHRFVRHPLYSGTFLAIWGIWIVVPQLSLLIANAIITCYTIMAIKWEEQKLLQEFGDDYRRYQQQVPRLVPLPGKKTARTF
jgi:protein-S-isoprenylcysteine O-methyltransferase Ste14